MDIETRVTNLENMLASIVDTLSNNKIYTDADIDGVRKSVSDVTPYTETKTAYYNESEKTFYGVPEGNIEVYFDNYNGPHTIKKVADRVTVIFDTLKQNTNITISIK